MGLFKILFGDSYVESEYLPPKPKISREEEIRATANTLGISVTDADINALVAGRMINMGPENQAEWDKLVEQRHERIKSLKLDEFKKLPPSMRQYLVDSIIWTRAIATINNATIDSVPKEKIFESLAYKYEALYEIVNITPYRSGTLHQMIKVKRGKEAGRVFEIEGGAQYATITLHEDTITFKQLLDAHAEQCATDALTGDLNK